VARDQCRRHCIGSHSNFAPGADQRAYSAIQGTWPQTLGYSLNDSPAALAASVVDKFWAWSDHRGNLEASFTKTNC
jgi:hypothetical protein